MTVQPEPIYLLVKANNVVKVDVVKVDPNPNPILCDFQSFQR